MAVSAKMPRSQPSISVSPLGRVNRDGKTGKTERRTVPGADFLWLVLQHVLPKWFRRARNFGSLPPNCQRLIALPHLLLKFVPASALAWVKPRAPILCGCCGAVMTIARWNEVARKANIKLNN